MSITYGAGNFFRSLNMIIYTTIYNDKGDSLSRNLKNLGLSSSNYARRHYVVSGEFMCNFPNSSLPDDTGGTVGTVWPLTDFKNVDEFTIISLEDKSSYHCFNPLGNSHVVHSEHLLTANTPFFAAKGSAYVATVDINIGDILHTAGSILVCENKDNTLISNKNGKIISFTSIKNS